MKVLAFNGSPHPNGSTNTSLKIIADELSKKGIETEIVQVGGKTIKGCVACYKCRELKRCVYSNDIVNEYVEKIASYDGIIIGSPVYYAGIAGTLKCFLDRLFFSGPSMRYKVGAAVVALRRSGGVTTFQQINNYFNLTQMVITPSQYWNVIHGTNSEEVVQDKEGVQIIQTIGQNMAWLLQTIEKGRDAISEPVPTERVRTNFIH
jgi:multimeric flavodoxin WrbA